MTAPLREYKADAENDLRVVLDAVAAGNRGFALSYLSTKYGLCYFAGMIEGAFPGQQSAAETTRG